MFDIIRDLGRSKGTGHPWLKKLRPTRTVEPEKRPANDIPIAKTNAREKRRRVYLSKSRKRALEVIPKGLPAVVSAARKSQELSRQRQGPFLITRSKIVRDGLPA